MLHVVIPPTLVDALEDVRKTSGQENVTELVQDALGLYANLARSAADGDEIFIRNRDGETIPVFLHD